MSISADCQPGCRNQCNTKGVHKLNSKLSATTPTQTFTTDFIAQAFSLRLQTSLTIESPT
eukprot:4527862-Pyramimonas_sp.AAC.1